MLVLSRKKNESIIINDHITVTGPYVLDTNHYNSAEIHPVYTLTIS